MYQWRGRRKVAGMKARKKLVGEQHRWWYSTVDADNVIVQILLRENNIVEICGRRMVEPEVAAGRISDIRPGL